MQVAWKHTVVFIGRTRILPKDGLIKPVPVFRQTGVPMVPLVTKALLVVNSAL